MDKYVYGTVSISNNKDNNCVRCISKLITVVKRKKDDITLFKGTLDEFFKYSMYKDKYDISELYQCEEYQYDLGMIITKRIDDVTVKDLISGISIHSKEIANDGEIYYSSFRILDPIEVAKELKKITSKEINVRAYNYELAMLKRYAYDSNFFKQNEVQNETINAIKYIEQYEKHLYKKI